MNNFCQDRDLLSIEPAIFLGGGIPLQQPVTGSDGVINGTGFTSAGSNFIAASVTAGMVLIIHSGIPSEGNAYEIVTVESANELSVSQLRPAADDDAVAPPTGTGLSFYVATFAPQITGVSQTLAEKLRIMAEVAGIRQADFVDSAQLRRTTALGVLAAVFVARAENADDHDANWIKAEHYRKQFRTQQLQLRLVVDADGDGTAEQTRTLGNVTLRRA